MDKKIKIEYYEFKKSAKELFDNLLDNNEFDTDDLESLNDYFIEFEELYNQGLTKVFYDEKIDENGSRCFKINDELVFYSVFDGCLCYSNDECDFENIERYAEDFQNENKLIRTGYDAFLNIINEDSKLISTDNIYIESFEDY